MTYEEFNSFCAALPATTHVVQWGNSDVWKVGGKVFAIGGWGEPGKPAFTFKTSELNFHFLSEHPGYRPAPYLAKHSGIAVDSRDTLPREMVEDLLEEAHGIVAAKLPKRVRDGIGL